VDLNRGYLGLVYRRFLYLNRLYRRRHNRLGRSLRYGLYNGLDRLDYLLNRQDLLNRLDGLLAYGLLWGLLLYLLGGRWLYWLDGLLEVLGYLLLGRLNLYYHLFPGLNGGLGGLRGLIGGVLKHRIGGDNLGSGAGIAPLGHGAGIGFRLVCSAIPLGITQDVPHNFHPYRGRPAAYHVQHLGRSLGKIDDP
jgi:hypothetical protein